MSKASAFAGFALFFQKANISEMLHSLLNYILDRL